ncbi:MAG: phospho-N-acetylmuramoyl-pentapeptide-transferase [Clostridiales bacterium]|jgi:phospho-N-acetylmuramoyl-pentapeptide-transferase|nr:phospho-N-acetylmuramoyl-pentapeptide-transferase [Clostridiales bacterium]
MALCPALIPYLTRLKFGQNVREDGPQSHLKKAGTPTMGGIVIVIAFLAGGAFFALGDGDAGAVMLTTGLFGVVGFLDDYIKIVKKRSMGLSSGQKIIAQIVVTTIFALCVPRSGVLIPFSGKTVHLGWLSLPLLYFVMIGGVNAVNLTDGLDGLNAGVTLLVSVFFAFAAYLSQKSGVMALCGAAAGSLLAFLFFNSYPARVFMGDTGSLALGGFVTSTALILRYPLFLALVGIIYVLEALSVMIQVSYFKATGGKRFFKMAPLHHHFELLGYTETKVVSMFYIVTAIAALIGFLGLNACFAGGR